MKKIFKAVLFIILALALFLFGPVIGESIYRRMTPAATITSWKNEANRLDETFPRTAENEMRRVEILRKLDQRGIHLDAGIRDEAIDNNFTPLTIFVHICWRWEEFMGMP